MEKLELNKTYSLDFGSSPVSVTPVRINGRNVVCHYYGDRYEEISFEMFKINGIDCETISIESLNLEPELIDPSEAYKWFLEKRDLALDRFNNKIITIQSIKSITESFDSLMRIQNQLKTMQDIVVAKRIYNKDEI